MRETARSCLQRRYQFEQEQLPPHAHPVDALEASLLPTTAKVENIALVLVLSHSGHTWRWSRLAKPPKTSKV
jgi:predicted TIM-barrel fold metal-dependent hydrolase